jgi:serine/threonine protein kinase
MFPQSSDSTCDLLDKLLQFSPDQRLTVEEALQHPYLGDYHDLENEPIADPIPDTALEFECELDGEELKRLLYAEVMRQ